MGRKLREWYEEKTIKIGRMLMKTRLEPNHLTIFSLIPALASFLLVSKAMLWQGLIFFLLSVSMDILDGSLARASKKTTRFGKLLDHYVDRCVESLYLIGLTAGRYIPGWMGALAVLSDISPSYIRARGEAEIGVQAMSVGLFERKEKIGVVAVGSIVESFYPGAVSIAVAILIVGSLMTSVQRLLFFKKAESSNHRNS